MSPNSKTESGRLIRQHLGKSGMSQADLASACGQSKTYVGFLVTGQRTPGPGWVDIIATGLGLTDEERAELHRAAARDHGFKIDLS